MALTLIVFLVAGGILLFLLGGGASEVFTLPTPTITLTPTLPPTFTPTVTPTETPLPTPTPLPPIDYTVRPGDTCLGLALTFDVSVASILELNGLGRDCLLTVDQQLKIPQPTPTPTPLATATLSGDAATEAAIPRVTYTVVEGDTLSSIAQNYNVATDTIKEANNMTSDVVFIGQVLVIPLTRLPTAGPPPTPTPPPPYDAPDLLLPPDGAVFAADASLSLQWSAVAELREGESYQVTVEDVTVNAARRLVQYTTATRIIVPADFRPPAGESHLFRWWVAPVRLAGAAPGGDPIYDTAGASSVERGFVWAGP